MPPKKPKKPSIAVLDKLWVEASKKRYGAYCAVCKKESPLNVHHIFSRSNRSVRWDLENAIVLCVGHHVFGNFSAHKSPMEFAEWLKEKRGEEWYLRIRKKASSVLKQDHIAIKAHLSQKLNELNKN